MKTKHWIAILAAILVISVFASMTLFMPGKESSWAQVSTDGNVDRMVNLLVDQQFTVPCPGGYNTVTVKDGGEGILLEKDGDNIVLTYF